MPDHVHLCVSIPPKFSVANTIGLYSSDISGHEVK